MLRSSCEEDPVAMFTAEISRLRSRFSPKQENKRVLSMDATAQNVFLPNGFNVSAEDMQRRYLFLVRFSGVVY